MAAARRGHGEGSVYKRSDGYWVAACEAGYDTNGRRRKLRAVRKHKVDALEALDELRRKAQLGVIPDRSLTVAEYLTFWLDDVKAGTVTTGSLREYRTRVDRINAEIGTVKLDRLTTAHVQRFANRLADKYPRSPTTRAHTLTTLRSALRWAVGASMIVRNPAEAVTGPRGRPTTKLDDTLEPAELASVLKAARGDRLEAMWWLALCYGLRLGELINLRWTDLDWTKDQLTVRQAKTVAGVRDLPMIPEAKKVLWAHHRSAGVVSIDGYVFVTEYGTKLYDKSVYREWNALLRRAGIAHRCRDCGTDDPCSTSVRRFHSSRHSAATALLEAGVPIEVIAAVLGHSSITITSSIYAKVRADLLRKGLTNARTARETGV